SDQAVGVDQGTSQLVLKICPLVLDLRVGLLEQHHRFAAAASPAPPTSNTPLSQSQLRLRPLVVARVVYGRPIGECRKGRQTNINPGACLGERQRLCRILDTEADIPFAALTLDGYGLDHPLDWAVQLDLDVPNTLQIQPCPSQPTAIPITGKGVTVEASTRLEARVASFLVRFHTAKEGFEGLLDSTQDVLTSRVICQREITSVAYLFQLVRLIV